MSLYRLSRPLLFSLDPETAHRLGLRLSALAFQKPVHAPLRAMGIDFPNPVGLAAGLDKDAAHIDGLARMGFGFIEVGTVTPRPQPGNAPPRLFRIPEKEALINRFGFNNVGVDAFLQNVARARWRGVLGINIGKNATTPAEQAADDYAYCLERVYGAASYVTVNISSPNTAGLRALQEKQAVEALLSRLARRREVLARSYRKRVPLVLKVAPDLDAAGIEAIAEAVRAYGIDGVIATNTTTSREGVENLPHANEAGGLSGAPVLAKSTHVLRELRRLLPDITLIGAGGILCGDDARQKREAGANLVQLYTGLIYRGPRLVPECASAFLGK
ncbi:MAG TPA: quinone-dependent dihydroorotate dehydrogenase [Burkholderiales bacterium]